MGCHCWVPSRVPLLCAVTACHCWVPWAVTNFGGLDVVPLLGTAECHCWMPWLGKRNCLEIMKCTRVLHRMLSGVYAGIIACEYMSCRRWESTHGHARFRISQPSNARATELRIRRGATRDFPLRPASGGNLPIPAIVFWGGTGTQKPQEKRKLLLVMMYFKGVVYMLEVIYKHNMHCMLRVGSIGTGIFSHMNIIQINHSWIIKIYQSHGSCKVGSYQLQVG